MSAPRNERTILVTGYSGQVGFELARALQGLGHVLTPDMAEFDLTAPDTMRAYLREHRPALIVNPAAHTAVDKAEEEREVAFAINGEAPAVIAEEAKRLGAGVIHYSTDYVFDGTRDGLYVEDDTPAPANVYGASKLAGEQALHASGVPHLVLRTSWVYGARGKNFLLTMLRLGREKEVLRIVADQVGAPTWSRTIADLTAHIVAQGVASGDLPGWLRERSGVYHLTASGATTWAEFAEAIFEDAGLEKHARVEGIPSSEYPTPAKRPLNSRMSGDKLAAVFGLRAPDWRVAMRYCLEDPVLGLKRI
jgi:dTDP-4-dehydrorhamnose reductase